MAKSDGSKGDRTEDSVSVKLKVSGGRNNEARQIATAFSKMKQALRASPGGGASGRSKVSSRQRGSAASGSAVARVSGGSSGVLGVPAKSLPLQRVAVRWGYVGNKGDGQWGAHGKYIERESSQEKEISREKLDRLAEEELTHELSGQSIETQTKEQDHESEPRSINVRYDRARDAAADFRRVPALRQSYLAAGRETAPTQSINDLRNLSSIGLVQRDRRGAKLLQSDAPDQLVQRRTEDPDRMRWGSGGEFGADRAVVGVKKKNATPGFGSAGEAVPIAETLDRWQKTGDDRMFKIIVSPEFGERLNMRSLVTRHMQQMEKDLGTKLEWVASAHHNTDNPHAHVAVRGVDDKGRTLDISPEYIAKGSRIRAQEIATRDLGYRTDRDVAAGLERQISQQRFTDIDRTLLKMGNEQGSPNIDGGLLKVAQVNARREIDFSGKPPADEKKRALRLTQIERLVFLERNGLATRVGDMKWTLSADLSKGAPDSTKLIRFDATPPLNAQARDTRLKQIRRLSKLTEMGLAEKVGNLTWKLNPSMETALRQMQKSQDRLKTKAEHREMISDPGAPLVNTELKTIGQRVSGKVVGTGLDEGSGRPYILIEGFDGKVHYVNQTFQVQKMRGEGELKAGEFISIDMVERKDRVRTEAKPTSKAPLVPRGEVLVEHGDAPYEFNKDNGKNYYAKLRSALGIERVVWGVDIKRSLEEVNATPGDSIILTRGAREKVTITETKKDGKEITKEVERVVWKTEISKMPDAVILTSVEDDSARVKSTTQRIQNYGRQLTPELLDAELLKGGVVVAPTAAKGSVASIFRDAAAKRLKKLEKVGAFKISGDQVAISSALAHDRVKFDDAGIKAQDFVPSGAVLASVMVKGSESIILNPTFGRKQIVTAVQLKEMGIDQKYIAADSTLFIGVNAKGNLHAAVIRPAQVPVMVTDPRANILDSMVQQLDGVHVPTNHPLASALKERSEEWASRGVDVNGKDFVLRSNVWRKGAELQVAAMSEGIEKVFEGLAKDKGKPVKYLEAQPGRQISGRVVFVGTKDGYTNVVLDSGNQLTHLKVPDSETVSVKAGDRMRAKAETAKTVSNTVQQRLTTWRFADLEREEARQKGREGRSF